MVTPRVYKYKLPDLILRTIKSTSLPIPDEYLIWTFSKGSEKGRRQVRTCLRRMEKSGLIEKEVTYLGDSDTPYKLWKAVK